MVLEQLAIVLGIFLFAFLSFSKIVGSEMEYQPVKYNKNKQHR